MQRICVAVKMFNRHCDIYGGAVNIVRFSIYIVTVTHVVSRSGSLARGPRVRSLQGSVVDAQPLGLGTPMLGIADAWMARLSGLGRTGSVSGGSPDFVSR